jgi:hypothetical protein
MMTMIWRHEVERELTLFMSPDGLRFQEGHDRTVVTPPSLLHVEQMSAYSVAWNC